MSDDEQHCEDYGTEEPQLQARHCGRRLDPLRVQQRLLSAAPLLDSAQRWRLLARFARCKRFATAAMMRADRQRRHWWRRGFLDVVHCFRRRLGRVTLCHRVRFLDVVAETRKV
eukprot:1123409-Prymnesium_polylepis.1